VISLPDQVSDIDDLATLDLAGVITHMSKRINDTLKMWLPETNLLTREVSELLHKCVVAMDNNYGIAEAVKWADGFTFPTNVTQSDWLTLQECGYDLQKLVQIRQGTRLCHRFNRKRVVGWSDLDPNKPYLLKLVDGIEIFTTPGFTPNRQPPPLRKKYKLVAQAVNKMMFELYKKGAVLLLPTDKLVKEISDIHYSMTNWAPKKGKEQGRPISDSSFLPDDSNPLNSKEVKDIVKEEWGNIVHPTIQTLVEMVLRMAIKYGRDNIELWKMDLANAFGLLNILPSSVHLVANELTDNVTMLYIVGLFGWTGTPYAFDVVTRSIRWGVRRVISGEVDMYVDDLIGCSSSDDVADDIRSSASVIRSLCGPDEELIGSKAMKENPDIILDSVAGHKEVRGRVVDILGWEFNLDRWEVFIAEHNFHKALYGFFSVNETEKVPYRDMERLASWASRYGAVARLMRPFIGGLHGSMKNYDNRFAAIPLTREVQFDIRMWRSYLCVAYLKKDKLIRNLDSFMIREPTVILQFDASLTGVGIVLTGRNSFGLEETFALGLRFPFSLGSDSSFQNVSEFMAVLAGIFLAIKLFGTRGQSVKLLGDSTTALKWSKNEHYRGKRVRRASIAYTIIGSLFDYDVVETIHVPGVENILCDGLSRNHNKSVQEQISGTGYSPVSIDLSSEVMKLLDMCNPDSPLGSDQEFRIFWNDLYSFIDEALN
jgi:hypothetical protein